MRKSIVLVVLLALLAPHAGTAWNNAGHMTTAAVAYLSLPEPAQDRVDALLREHPDFPRLARGLSQSAPDFGAVVFLRAAIWPDLIKSDSRFFNDAIPSAVPTPLLPGFPDMKLHKSWHYIDQPFSTDGTPTTAPEEPNALTQIVAFRAALGDPAVPGNVRAYDLSWLLHLVGDVHQPLHGAERFSAAHRTGDAGGNLFRLGSSEGDLHSFWDGALGRDDDPQRALALARTLMKEFRPDGERVGIADDAAAPGTVEDWVDESAALAEYVVYTVGTEAKHGQGPSPSSAYRILAGAIARHRVAVAGYCLGALIEDRLE